MFLQRNSFTRQLSNSFTRQLSNSFTRQLSNSFTRQLSNSFTLKYYKGKGEKLCTHFISTYYTVLVSYP